MCPGLLHSILRKLSSRLENSLIQRKLDWLCIKASVGWKQAWTRFMWKEMRKLGVGESC